MKIQHLLIGLLGALALSQGSAYASEEIIAEQSLMTRECSTTITTEKNQLFGRDCAGLVVVEGKEEFNFFFKYDDTRNNSMVFVTSKPSAPTEGYPVVSVLMINDGEVTTTLLGSGFCGMDNDSHAYICMLTDGQIVVVGVAHLIPKE